MAEPHQHPPPTGHRWLDLTLALSAILVSCISLYVATSELRTQRQLLAASVWPYLRLVTSNYDEREHRSAISLEVHNQGVGPAKIESFQLRFRDQVLATPFDLFKFFAGQIPKDAPHFASSTSDVAGTVLPARDEVHYFVLPREGAPPGLWDAMNYARLEMVASVCYCSVLDQCWTVDSSNAPARAVARCPKAEGPQFPETDRTLELQRQALEKQTLEKK